MNETKSVILRCRCTPSEKKRIEQQALNRNMTISSYITESAMAGRSRTPRVKKDVLCKVVSMQEKYNKAIEDIKDQGDFVSKDYVLLILDDFGKEIQGLWQCL